VSIVSFLGIPSSWKTIIFGVLGVLIMMIALFLRRDIATGALCMHLAEEKQTDSYTQNGMLPKVARGDIQESNEEHNHESNGKGRKEDITESQG